MQVLDTDYESYLIVYTCQDSSEWLESRSGIEMEYEQVWNAYLNQAEYKYGKRPTENLYDGANFQNLKGITQNWIYKENVQIYVRPTSENKLKAFDKVKLSQLQAEIS